MRYDHNRTVENDKYPNPDLLTLTFDAAEINVYRAAWNAGGLARESCPSENLVQTDPLPSKTPTFNRFSLAAPQP